jgi:hypothetical protein
MALRCLVITNLTLGRDQAVSGALESVTPRRIYPSVNRYRRAGSAEPTCAV